MNKIAHRRAEGQAPAADPIASALLHRAAVAVRALEDAPADMRQQARAGDAIASLLTYTVPQEGPAGSMTGWCE